MKPQVQHQLLRLGYTPQWIESGFLTEELLQEQINAFETGDDPHTEHYRYATFRSTLASRESLSDTEVNVYLDFAKQDGDQAMARAALVDLLRWHSLLPEQRERLSHHSLFAVPPLQKIIAADALMAALREPNVLDEAFRACVAQGARLQRRLVDHPGLTVAQLELLAEQGVSRAVRNTAVSRLQRHRSAERRHRNESGLETFFFWLCTRVYTLCERCLCNMPNVTSSRGL